MKSKQSKSGIQVRQGDVLVESAAVTREELIDRGGKVLPREAGRVVLAHGEATGHAHAIADAGVELIELQSGERFLFSEKGGTLRHEEHGFIDIPAGVYRVIHPQREYSPEEIRNIAD